MDFYKHTLCNGSLYALESRVNVPESEKDYPAVYFMGTMIEGAVPVMTKLVPLVKLYLSNPDSLEKVNREVLVRIPEIVEPSEVNSENQVFLAYFYEQGCQECGRAEEIIDWLKKSYSNVHVDLFDINEDNGKLLSTALGMRTGVPGNRLMSTPMLFVGDKAYVLSENISRKRLAVLVEIYSAEGAAAVWRNFSKGELKRAESAVSDLFSRFTIFAVTFAGLGDGINPCAFATILFFVSYLGMIGRKRNEILMVGLSFTFAVFLTYFLLGLGFFKIVKQMSHIEILSKIIFGGTAVVCFIFGFLSISDYFKTHTGKTSDMSLQLPLFLKRRIHTTIRKKVRMKSFIAGALAAGFIVSILELACTGQVYLPTIMLMLNKGSDKTMAIFYLLLYNLCFIIPLLFVFGVVYFGASSRSIARIMETRLGMVKILLAAVFFVIGGLLFRVVL